MKIYSMSVMRYKDLGLYPFKCSWMKVSSMRKHNRFVLKRHLKIMSKTNIGLIIKYKNKWIYSEKYHSLGCQECMFHYELCARIQKGFPCCNRRGEGPLILFKYL